MASDVTEITIKFEENNIVKVKELDKVVLTKGAWATIMFKYQQWNAKDEQYGPDCYSIRRYQKRSGNYMQKSKFNISSKDQAKKIIEVLQTWIGEESQ
jgi:hypothetical protein